MPYSSRPRLETTIRKSPGFSIYREGEMGRVDSKNGMSSEEAEKEYIALVAMLAA